jgi:hypothetical protein
MDFKTSVLSVSSALAGKLVPDVFTHLRPVSVPASLYHLRTVAYILHGTLSMYVSVAKFSIFVHHEFNSFNVRVINIWL